jgi:Mg-chelatase subunit ChlD
MKTKLLVAALFVATAGVVVGYPLHTPGAATPATPNPVAVPAVATPNARPKVDVVFVLDTTGSMAGLIQAAKDNIWSIATTMASAQPAPEIRIGLVAFRDRGDAYVTQVIDLNSDLDSMYATLMDFQADGGGDTPESVNQALYEAVHRMSWSQGNDAYKAVFLVGDAPAHAYPGDIEYPETLKAASAKGIVINTIQAGEDQSTRAEWQRIAQLNQGAYFQVGQAGSAIAMATPFDEQIATLSKALDDTRLFFGDADTQRGLALKAAATDKLHADGSVASRAKRAAFNASASGKENLLGDNELVEAVTSGRVELSAIDSAHLPAPLRELGKDEQAQVIEETAKKRAELNTQIAALASQRRAYVESEIAKRDDVAQSLDYQLFDAVKAQAGEKGLRYEGKPVN